MQDYWYKQAAGQPLFPDLLWSRPENRNQAGKLLIVGGNAHGFAAAGEYAPSTLSGSFSRKALAELLAMSQWADSILLAGDFGRNSETSIVLEQALAKYDGQLTLTKDAIDYFIKGPAALLQRQNTLLVASFAQLQKLATGARFTTAFTFDMDFLRLVEALHTFTGQHQASIIVKHLETIFVASKGQVSTTKLETDQPIWRVKTAASASVWWLQNSSKTFEALTAAVLEKKD